MQKIAIFQNNLNVGGIQKSLINLLNNIDKNKYEIDVYLFEKINFYENIFPKNIQVKYIKRSCFITRFILFDIYKHFKRKQVKDKSYDVAIDFDSYQHATAFNAITCNAKKKVMWIHNDMEQKIKEEIKYRVLHFFFKGKYKYFDEFVAVSEPLVDKFKKIHNIKDKKYRVIPNYINTSEIIEKSKEISDLNVDNNIYNLISVGRIAHQKGYDILVEYMEKIAKKRKEIHLYIIGDGPERAKIEKTIKEKNISSYITLLGNKTNPYKYINQMDGFVLTSRYEGQGMVILEAKTLGLDIFITKNLEQYNENIKASDDLVEDIVKAKKKTKKIDMLEEYNNKISISLKNLFEE